MTGQLNCTVVPIWAANWPWSCMYSVGSSWGWAKVSCILSIHDFLLVAPDTINNHVKTCREEQKNLHFFAPEYGGMVWQQLQAWVLLACLTNTSMLLCILFSAVVSWEMSHYQFCLFACFIASTPLSFDNRGGREGCRIIIAWYRGGPVAECRERLITEHCFCVTEVANVTTAVDIYSFGMCALEVSVEHCGYGTERIKSREGDDSMELLWARVVFVADAFRSLSQTQFAL